MIGIYLLSPKGAALLRRKTNARVIVPLLRSSILLWVRVYPGFHIGLCLHSTLGFAGVSCLKALVINLNFDAVALNGYSYKGEYFRIRCFGGGVLLEYLVLLGI